MTFAIRIGQSRIRLPDTNEWFYFGEIRIDSFEESFYAPASCWSPDDYIGQWRRGLERACAQLHSSALITSLPAAGGKEASVWWPMIIEGDHARLWQELRHPRMGLADWLRAESWESVLPDEFPEAIDGQPVSEWVVPVDDFRAALELDDFVIGEM